MEVNVVHGSIVEIESDVLIVNLFEGVTSPGGATGAVDRALQGAITELIRVKEITGKLMETPVLHTFNKIAPKRVMVLGLGKANELDGTNLRKVAGAAARCLSGKGIRTITSIVHGAGIGGFNPADAARAVIEGTLLGLYQGDIYKSPKKDKAGNVERITVVEHDESKIPEIKRGVREGTILATATNDARDLSNEPANNMTPRILAERAREVAEKFDLEYQVFDEECLSELGMGALLSVGQGSSEPPRLISLRYTVGKDKPTLALAGKGLTFDSGGISIKPQEGLHMMKYDMAGGAAVIQALRAIAELKPHINVLGLIPSAENMPSGSAFRPGDVVRCMNGKTVEIITTDAEGRMILADALTYAARQGANWIVDIATLTGSCAIALGDDITGVMSNNRALIEKLMEASQLSGERLWELPLPTDYKEQLKSNIADIKNVGSKYGGAIAGGLFLEEFVEELPWVHMDIAGTAYTSRSEGSNKDAYMAPGATGVGVRTLVMLAALLGGGFGATICPQT